MLEIEPRNWNMNLGFEVEAWSWSLKFEVEFWGWSLKQSLKLKFEVEGKVEICISGLCFRFEG